MEWLGLVEPITVLSSNYVGMQVFLSDVVSFVKQLVTVRISRSITDLSGVWPHRVVELTLPASQFDVGNRLGPGLRVLVGLPEGGAPVLVVTRVRLKHSCLSITPEEVRSGRVECLLVLLEPVGLPPLVGLLEGVFLHETPSADL